MTDFIPAHKEPLDEGTREKLVAGESRHPMTFIERLAMPLLPSPEAGPPPKGLLNSIILLERAGAARTASLR